MSPHRPFAAALAVLAALAAAPAARAAVLIQVVPSVGPNVFNSPSYDAYRDGAVAALRAGAAQAGTPGTPAFYQAIAPGGTVALADLVVTDFPSWRGAANPAGAFAAETGTRLYFGVAITAAAGETFRISDLSFDAASTDPFATLDFALPAGSYAYSLDYVGIRADGSLVTGGPATQEVVALYGRGSSNAFEVLSSDPGATDQARIDAALAGVDGFRYTGTYSLGAATGTAAVDVGSPVPAPPAAVLLAAGAVGLVVRRRR